MRMEDFKADIIRDVEGVFSSDEFREAADRMAERVEANRRKLADILRDIPAALNLAKAAMTRGEPPVDFLMVGRQDEDPYALAHSDFEGEARIQEALQCLVERLGIYQEAAVCRCCELRLMSDGVELVRPAWTPNFLPGPMRVYDTTWSQPQSAGKFPHDRMAYLVGTGMLYRKWMANRPIMRTAEVRLKDGKEGALPFLPEQAAALDAVDRWPVVFFTPSHLAKQLDRIAEVRIGPKTIA